MTTISSFEYQALWVLLTIGAIAAFLLAVLPETRGVRLIGGISLIVVVASGVVLAATFTPIRGLP